MKLLHIIRYYLIVAMVLVGNLSPVSLGPVPKVLAESTESEYVEPPINYSGSIPTTSNPVGNGTKAVRIMSNPSFEESDITVAWTSWTTAAENKLRGWFTSHPFKEEWYDGVPVGTTQYRLIELQRNNPAVGACVWPIDARRTRVTDADTTCTAAYTTAYGYYSAITLNGKRRYEGYAHN